MGKIYVKLYASISHREWRNEFLKCGVKAGDIEGEAGYDEISEKAILVQHIPFPYGYWNNDAKCEDDKACACKIIVFKAPLDEVFIDWGDYDLDELNEPENWVEDKVGETWNHWSKDELRDVTMYGAFVKEIKPEQIICVLEGRWKKDESWEVVRSQIL